ncbi:terpene cyclase [Saitozyma podzolica]|uniref:Squalene synthase n=1 Tax=Saitozyma podzolica TaxID=1890683 RepID=A0A427YNI9_9TREE|nr:terpene cyclase [Saitozyma podzolica]
MGRLDTILQFLTHPTELRAVINYKIWRDVRDITKPEEFPTTFYDRPTMRRCWELLDLTSRSFAVVIKDVEGDLARTICIFYVILRALDTIEDDMTLPNSVKLPMLRSLHLKLHEPGWNFDGSGPNEKDRQVLVEFDVVQAEFALLDPKYQVVIEDIARKMGRGMADFAALATPQTPVAEVNSIDDYDLYCHYVAGLVGEGLSGLFASSGKEREFLADQLTLSNSMGLLLQKTNIFRDIKEDVDEGRGFWPRAIWGAHGFASMKELVDPEREKDALFAASEMVLDALRHATDALDYMTLLKCQSVFNFVAIPAVMAMATLERCFMNPEIFRRNVKIRRGEAVKLIMRSVNPRDVSYIFRDYARNIHRKVHKEDPNLLKLSIACAKIEQWTEHHYPSFLSISAGSGGGGIQTQIDQYTSDARAPLYAQMYKDAQEKASRERREAYIADLRKRGILKAEKTDEAGEKKEVAQLNTPGDNELKMWHVVAMIVAVLVAMVGLGALIVWVILTYFND